MPSHIALITGASTGIGFALSKLLSSRGTLVILTGRNKEKIDEAVKSLTDIGLPVDGLLLDITDEKSVINAKSYVSDKYGYLDLLVNNAAIRIEEYGKKPSEQPLSHWARTFETNLYGTVRTTQSFLSLLKKSTSGRIVNLSSLLGSTKTHTFKDSYTYSDSFKSLPAYSASKSAINSWTVHLSYELRDTEVSVCSVHPGYTRTNLNDGVGDQLPEDAASKIAYACLSTDSAINGAFLFDSEQLPW